MAEEPLVLGREDRLDHVAGDAVERHLEALFDEVGEGRPAVPVVDDGRLRPHRDVGKRAVAIELTGDR